MIDCTTYRRALLADPRDRSAELAEHVASCAACAAYTRQVLRFDERLAAALRHAPSGAGAAATAASAAEAPRVIPFRSRRTLRARSGWLAAAASVLIALAMMTSLWLAAPHASLAADVVAHMAGEPQAWARTDEAVPAAQLDQVLREAHVTIDPRAPLVTYAHSCMFRGHHVPHLVVQTREGPVTVMVLVHERVKAPVRFDEGGYRGILVPDDGHGSLAVLARAQEAVPGMVSTTAAQVRAALHWEG
jgi:hypothetical protein